MDVQFMANVVKENSFWSRTMQHEFEYKREYNKERRNKMFIRSYIDHVLCMRAYETTSACLINMCGVQSEQPASQPFMHQQAVFCSAFLI